MNFTDFPLDGALQEGLTEAGYITCMPVQEQVLKVGLEGADLYVQSQTGTGKTAAYLVTILQRLVSDPALSGKKALIMVPTRELAVQVEEEARILGSCMKLKSASFYGGVGYGRQVELLKEGVDVLIGTPGRVIDLQESGQMDLSQVAFLVIDEADRMFDMGFYPDLRTLIRVLPGSKNRQTMLFSATLNASVKNLAWEYTNEAQEVTIEAENVTVDEIDQMLFHVSSDQKMKLLLGLLKKENPESVIVFCNTKRMSEVVSKRLRINGYEADFIIGDLPQSKRLQVIDSFKSGSLRMLVATDVAARGIDVDSLAMVINYDLPNEAENYVHRIGRTARAGKTGKAYSFCSEQDVYNLPAIEKYVENKVPSCVPGEDDLIEDKSAHVYIRTDTYNSDYDDGDGEKGGYRGGRGRSGGSRDGGSRDRRSGPQRHSSDGRSRDGRPRDGQPRSARPDGHDARPDRHATRPDGHAARPDDDRSTRRPTSDGRGRARPESGGRRQGQDQQDKDLSRLSFEERMNYYKTKYGSEEAARAAANQHEAASSGTSSSGRRDKPTHGQGRPEGRRSASQGHSSSGPRSPGPRSPGPQSSGRQGRGQGRPDGKRQDARPPAGKPATRGDAGRRPEAARSANRDTNAQSPRTASAPKANADKKAGIGSFLKKLFGKTT